MLENTAGLAYDTQHQLQQEFYQPSVMLAQAPALGFLKAPAVVLAGLEPSQDGSVVLSAEQLQQLLADAASLSDSSTANGAGEGSSSSSSGSMFGPGGFAVVHVAAYVLQQPRQFASCIAAVQGAAPPEAAVEPGARRDMGLHTDVDGDAICALVGCRLDCFDLLQCLQYVWRCFCTSCSQKVRSTVAASSIFKSRTSLRLLCICKRCH
jgi:hypothetical protein